MSSAILDETGPVFSDFASDPDYREILEVFAAGLSERHDSLLAAYRHGDVERLRTVAHQLKGAGGGFGFHGLTEVAALLEQACKSDQPDRLADCLERTLNYLNRVRV
jgi:HPt (histidine-containing phosphotransfer) domain-containing protein